MLVLGPRSAEAVKELKDQGIEMWDHQTERVQIPKDISTLDSEDLSDLFVKLTAWSNYASHQLSAAQIDEREAERKLNFYENKLLVERMGSTQTKSERITVVKAQIAIDPTVEKLQDEVDKAYAYRKMVETVFYNLERDITLISREITRRTNDYKSRKDRYTI